MVVDIDATTWKHREPDYKMIENLAFECRMPLCYGGGIKTVQQAQRIFSLGVEKIAISSAAIESPTLFRILQKRVGNQSVVVVLDIRKNLLMISMKSGHIMEQKIPEGTVLNLLVKPKRQEQEKLYLIRLIMMV